MRTDDVKKAAADAVKSGENLREQIRRIVERAAESAGKTGEEARSRLGEVMAATIDGATGALDRSAPEDASSALRQVIDGLGDGLQRTAQATKLAVEEAGANGKAFAQDDLKGVASDLKTIGEMFVETVERGAKGVLGQANDQARGVREHAERTLTGIMPSLEDAARAALPNPAGLIGDSASAAGNLARETAGSLLSSVGKLLGNAGDRVRPDDQR